MQRWEPTPTSWYRNTSHPEVPREKAIPAYRAGREFRYDVLFLFILAVRRAWWGDVLRSWAIKAF